MKNQLPNIYTPALRWVMLFLFIGLVGCDDDEIDQTNQGEFALITASLGADGQTRAFYLQRASVDNTESLDNSLATELDPGTQAMVHAFNGSVYFSEYANGRMDKWTIDENNNASKDAEMNISELLFQGNTTFRDESTAFVGGLSTDIIIFNPTTMKKTGTIDISAVSNIGEATDFPVAGGTIAAESVTEMIVRDNLLYVALMPMADVATFTPGSTGCSIVVVDLDEVDVSAQGNATAVLKRIEDERGSHTGAWGSGGGGSFIILDENNDIYMLCHNMWAGWRAAYDKPACILKIASGETDFDADYYFDLESAAIGNGNPVMNLEYYGDGKFLAAVQDPEALDPDNLYSYFTDPIWQWWSFDLYNQSADIVSEDYTRGALAAVSYFENGFGYVPFDNSGDNYVMKVDLGTLEASKLFETDGLPILYSLE